MGLFRAIGVYLIGSFIIKITKEGGDHIKNIPIIGSTLESMLKDQREHVVIILLAITQLII